MRSFAATIVGLATFATFGAVSAGQTARPSASPVQAQAATASSSSLPDWAGIWTPNFSSSNASGEQPLLSPQSQAELKALEEARAKHEEPATDAANCLPPGMPTIMFMPYDIEFLFTPGRVTIIQEAYMQVRRVFTDGRSHPADLDPTFNGHSIGHWEGDTLVVDTVGLGHRTPLGFDQLRHGPHLHVVERIHLIAPDTLELQMTLTDPDVLQKPWHLVRTYARHRDWDQLEYICEENNRNPIDDTGKTSTVLRK